MLSRKMFENLHFMMAILVLLEQVLRQIVFEFFALVFLRSSPNTGMMQYFRTFSISVYRYKA